MLYAATSAGCGGAPNGVWAIDLDSETKPVVSWKTNGGPVVGAVAFTPDGTLFAAIGAGQTAGDGKANAIVALDPKTLQLKDWFTQPAAEFVTGPTILRHSGQGHRRRGDQGRPRPPARRGVARRRESRHAASRVEAVAGTGSDGQCRCARHLAAVERRYDLDSAAGRRPSGEWRAIRRTDAISAGAVIALKLIDGGGALSLEPGWVSHDLSAAATPITVNGVVFTLATGLPATRRAEARRPCSTRTTARRASGCGTATRR